MTYGSPLGAVLPVVTDRGPAFAQGLNDVAKLIRRRVEAKVNQAGLLFDAPLDMGGFAMSEVKGLAFKNQAAVLDPGVYLRALFHSGQELYVNAGSSQLRLTKDGSLDFSSVGAIVGAGYGQNGTEIKWAGSSMYELWARTGVYADAEIDDLRLAAGFSGSAVGPLLQAPAMSADYEWQLPNAQTLNLERQGLFVNAVGVMQWSATVKHEEMSLFVAPSQAYGGSAYSFDNTAAEEDTILEADGAAGFSADFPIPLNEGDRIKAITSYVNKAGVAGITWTLRRISSGSSSSSTGVTWSNSSAGAQAASTTLGTPITVAFSEAYLIRAQGGNTVDRHFGFKVVYDRP